MKGSLSVPFSTLFADTVACHGVAWAYGYYVEKRGMPGWEFMHWRKVTR